MDGHEQASDPEGSAHSVKHSPERGTSGDERSLPELVVGFVCPLGAPLTDLIAATKKTLSGFPYDRFLDIKVTDFFRWLLPASDVPPKGTVGEYDRYRALMNAGDLIRRTLTQKGGTVLPMLRGIACLRGETVPGNDSLTPSPATVYLIDSIKTPEEVEVLRAIYGPWFVLIGAYQARIDRVATLTAAMGANPRDPRAPTPGETPELHNKKAEELIQRDENGRAEDDYGQNVRDAFPLADLIVNAHEPPAAIEHALHRFFDLLFGPFGVNTPTPVEQGMYLAASAALRSSAIARQVGSVITTSDGQVLAMGTNEAPKAGGGAYWPDQADGEPRGDAIKHPRRTFEWLEDPTPTLRESRVKRLLKLIAEAGWTPPQDVAEGDLDAQMKSLQKWQAERRRDGWRSSDLFDDTIEFHREVHAEMLALTDAARRGIDLTGAELYTTTFPCHDCAKHIVAAGIKRVVFLEPYPKSLVRELHPDSIYVDGETVAVPGDLRVVFTPFVGVAPRRYATLFRVHGRRKALAEENRKYRMRMADYDEQIDIRPGFGYASAAIRAEVSVYQELKHRYERKRVQALEGGLSHDTAALNQPTVEDLLTVPLAASDSLSYVLDPYRFELLRALIAAERQDDLPLALTTLQEYVAALERTLATATDGVTTISSPSGHQAELPLAVQIAPTGSSEVDERSFRLMASARRRRERQLLGLCEDLHAALPGGAVTPREYLQLRDEFIGIGLQTAAENQRQLTHRLVRNAILRMRDIDGPQA